MFSFTIGMTIVREDVEESMECSQTAGDPVLEGLRSVHSGAFAVIGSENVQQLTYSLARSRSLSSIFSGNDLAIMHTSVDKPDSSSLNASELQHVSMAPDRIEEDMAQFFAKKKHLFDSAHIKKDSDPNTAGDGKHTHMEDSKESLVIAHSDPAIDLNSVHSVSPAQPKDSSALSVFTDFFQPLPAQDEMISDSTVVVTPPVSSLPDHWSASSLTKNDSVSRNASGCSTRSTTPQSETVDLSGGNKEYEALNHSIDNTIINTFMEDPCVQSLTCVSSQHSDGTEGLLDECYRTEGHLNTGNALLSSADWKGFGNEWEGLGSLSADSEVTVNLIDNDFNFSAMSQDSQDSTFTTRDVVEVFGQFKDEISTNKKDTGLGEEGKDLHSSKSLVNYVEMTFEQLQHHLLTGKTSQAHCASTNDCNSSPKTQRANKSGFKYTNKQPTIKKEKNMDFKIKIDKKFTKIAKLNHSISAPCLIAPNDSNVISPLTIDFSSSPKRIKKVAKRRNSTEILLPKVSNGSEGAQVFIGAQVETVPLTSEIFNNLWSTEALDASISESVFHGYRRRTKLTEAELEDQKLSFDQDGLLSGSRGRYKCGRCGQLKTNHICEFFEDTAVCSTATQIHSISIIDPVSKELWEGDRFLTVGKRKGSILTETNDSKKPSNSSKDHVKMEPESGDVKRTSSLQDMGSYFDEEDIPINNSSTMNSSHMLPKGIHDNSSHHSEEMLSSSNGGSPRFGTEYCDNKVIAGSNMDITVLSLEALEPVLSLEALEPFEMDSEMEEPQEQDASDVKMALVEDSMEWNEGDLDHETDEIRKRETFEGKNFHYSSEDLFSNSFLAIDPTPIVSNFKFSGLSSLGNPKIPSPMLPFACASTQVKGIQNVSRDASRRNRRNRMLFLKRNCIKTNANQTPLLKSNLENSASSVCLRNFYKKRCDA
mmetsp:Transcript_6268/g.6431  ORF Transcript_6268/g.6431 Transcript_6268/m.6431 type:complete len:933 (-) Transcript_6268:153-2951(-)